MDRRSFIAGAGTLALAQLLAACSTQNNPTLTVRLLKNSLPAPVLNQFRKTLQRGLTLDVKSESQLRQLFEELQSLHRQPPAKEPAKSNFPISLPFVTPKETAVPDLVTLGDYWLAKAIEQKLIQPLDTASLSNWQKLPERWQKLVQRNQAGEIDPQGKIWAAPYRWGTTVIAYRPDKFKTLGLQPPQDWSDLWREELRQKISLPDQAREVIGLTLKKLGKSYNTRELDKVENLQQELEKLNQQVKFYSSNSYLEPLLLGDTLVAVGWSSDVLPVLDQESKIKVVIPKSGTSIWADLWVRPARNESANVNPLLNKWLDFCWQPPIAVQLALQTKAASPVFAEMKPEQLPKELRRHPVMMPDADIFNNSEFIHALPDEVVKQYGVFWEKMRIGNRA